MVLVAVALSSAAAFAAPQDFGAFAVDVPAGWTAEQDGTTGILSKADNSGNISITIDSSDGASVKELAEAFRAEFAKSFASVGALEGPNDGDYEWEMKTADGVVSHALVSGTGDQFMLIVATGAISEEEVGAVISTLQIK